MRLRSFSVWLLLGVSGMSACGAQQQPQAAILPGSEPLWMQLNELAVSLPTRYDAFVASLTEQVGSLEASNDSLQSSNISLTQQNADLQTSLARSQEAAATSAASLERLQKATDASMRSTIRLEGEIARLRVQNGILKWAGAAAVVAIGLHVAGVW